MRKKYYEYYAKTTELDERIFWGKVRQLFEICRARYVPKYLTQLLKRKIPFEISSVVIAPQ